jgi:hypothetical protein
VLLGAVVSDGGAAPRTKPAPIDLHPGKDGPGNLVIDERATSAGSAEQEFVSVPRAYRTMSPNELQAELKRLRESARKLPAASKDRIRMEGLIQAVEQYEKTGVDPNALLDEITSTVAELRGLKPLQPVRFRILQRDALRHLLEEKLEEDLPPGWLGEYESVCKLMGALPERINLRKTMLGLLSEQIAGLYDDKTKRLYVLADFNLNRPLAKIILAHEICHALQDQHYNLRHLPLTNVEQNDAAIAALSVVEGDATLLMQDYAGASIKSSDILKLLDIFQVDQRAMNSAPYFLRQQLIFPYMGGADFLTRVSYQDWDLRELALQRPPASTEQILHPDKYASGDMDAPTTVTIPDLEKVIGTGWKTTIRSNWGEFQLKTIFEMWREWSAAKQACEGWDGDQFLLLRKEGDSLYVWQSVWDTEKDATEFFEAFSELMRKKRYRSRFEDMEFRGDNDVRTLDYVPGATADTEKSELHLSFRRRKTTVITEITTSGSIAEKIPELDTLLLTAAQGDSD